MKFNYDSSNDIFVVCNEFSKDEKFKGNMVVGSLVLDFSTKGKLRGIEILNASELLDEKALGLMTNAEFNAVEKANTLVIEIIIETKDSRVPAKFLVPLEKAVCA